MKILWTLCALVLFTVPAFAGPTKTAKSSGKGKTSNAFSHFKSSTNGHDTVNAYLLALASETIYPQTLGVKSKDHKAFKTKFEATVRRWGIKKCEFIQHTGTDTEAVVMSTDKVVVVVFRGSETGDLTSAIKDWIVSDARIRMIDMPTLGKGVKVHVGFWKALDSVHTSVTREIARQGGFKGKSVFLTGHSLGGALATLCAMRLSKEGKSGMAVYTYGAPRVGNDKFQLSFPVNLQRYVYKNDLVPMVPDDVLLGYRHVGRTNNITGNGTIKLGDKEHRFVGSLLDHMGSHYCKALLGNLASQVRGKMPTLGK